MTFKGLLILTTVFIIGSADAFAIRPAARSHRKAPVRTGTTRTIKNSKLRSTGMDRASRGGPVNAYSSRGHTMKPFRNKKSIRGGGRGTIKVLR